MSVSATKLAEAQAVFDAAQAERKRLDPRGLKAREELAEAALLEAQEAHVEEQQKTSHELYAAVREHEKAMEDTVSALTAYVEARERLTATECERERLTGRGRKLQIDVPSYDSLPARVPRDNALRDLLNRAKVATRDGLW